MHRGHVNQCKLFGFGGGAGENNECVFRIKAALEKRWEADSCSKKKKKVHLPHKECIKGKKANLLGG